MKPKFRDRDPAVPEAAGLAAWIAAVRGRLVRLVLAEGMLRVAAVFIGALGLALLLDFLFELPRWARGGSGALVLTGTSWALVAWVWRSYRLVPDRDRLALLVERRSPAFRSRLISALQLSRAGLDTAEAKAFVRRMADEARRTAGGLDSGEVAPTDAVVSAAWRSVPLGVLFIGLFAYYWPVSGVLIRRALLEELEMPRRTRIVEATGSKVIGRGDDLRLSAVAEGVVPKAGRLLVRHETGRLQELPMDAESPGAFRFARVLSGVPGSFHYRIRLNDAETEEYRVEVLPRPVVTNLVLTQVLPAYTGVAPRRVVPGDLSLLRGSRLRVEGSVSQPLKSGRVRLSGVDRTPEVVVDGENGTRFTGEISIDDPRINGFSIEVVDRRDIPSQDPAVYAVSVVEDQAPQVRVVVPSRREELVTPRGTVLVAFEAKDDFGLGSLRIRHQPASSTNDRPAAIELDLAGETSGVVRRRFEWRLSGLQPPFAEGAMEEFWVEAADRNDIDGPKVGRSERYLLRVVTEAEKRADLLGRAGDAIGRLGDVAQGQERLNESLGRLILARPTGP